MNGKNTSPTRRATEELIEMRSTPLKFSIFEAKNEGLEELGGGFKYFLFSPLFGEDSHLD